MSRLELPQHPHSRPFPQWPSRPDPGQQSKQQSFSFPRLWIWTPTIRPAITASKPTTTSFSPRGYTNTPRWQQMFDTHNSVFRLGIHLESNQTTKHGIHLKAYIRCFMKGIVEVFFATLFCSCFGQKCLTRQWHSIWKRKYVRFYFIWLYIWAWF